MPTSVFGFPAIGRRHTPWPAPETATSTWLDHIWHAAACTHPIRLRGQVKHIDPAHRRTPAHRHHRHHARPGDLQALRQPPRRHLPRLRRNLPPRRLPPHPRRADRRQRRPRRRRHPPGRLRHLHRPLLRPGPHPRQSASTPAPTGPAAPAGPSPATPAATPQTCPHGRPLACFARHHRDDTRLGQPLCPDCYDYNAHAVWNNAAGELWRRTKQAIERHLGQLARRRGVRPIRVPCGNGKYRLWPRSASRTAKPPNTRPAARSTSTPCSASTATTPPTRTRSSPRRPASPPPTWKTPYATPPPPSATSPRRTRPSRPAGSSAGATELDVRVITMRGTGTITDLAVASYLAKYSTKGTETTGHASARLTHDTIDLYANPARHPRRTAHRRLLAARPPPRLHQPAPLGPHARLRRPLPHQSPPLLHPLPRPPPGPHHLPAQPRRRTRTRTHPQPPTTPTTKPPSSSAPSPTPEPDGQPAATPSSPTPPPTKPENAAKPDTKNSPTNTTVPQPAARPHKPSAGC